MFLLVFKRVVDQPFFVDYGLAVGCGPLSLIVVTYLLRMGVGKWLLRAGHHREAYDYSHARRVRSVTVGGTEAGVNRFVAAEASRRLGRPQEAIEILDERYRAPRREAVRQLLATARVDATADLTLEI